jgi:hypothetical protein
MQRTYRSPSTLVWEALNHVCSYYNNKDYGSAVTQLLTNKYAALYRLASKQKPKKVKPLVVTRAIKFQQDQLALLAEADKFQVILNSFKRDLEEGNLNKDQINELYSSFYELQRQTTEVRSTNKKFLGQTAEDTAKLAIEGLKSSN